MKNKRMGFLLIFLTACLYIGIGVCFWTPPYPAPKTVFDLQNEYAQKLEEKLVHLLEPATGPGNIQTSVQATITHQNIIKEQFDPATHSKTVIREKGPFLVNQSVSILINDHGKADLPLYYRLAKAAIGLNLRRGDELTIEMLPFKKPPLWTLGLSPLCLIRISVILAVLILIGIFWLIHEWINASDKTPVLIPSPDKKLWQETERLSTIQLSNLLKVKRPEITAFILYHLNQEKAAEIIDLLPSEYMNQIILHLKHIEKLNIRDKAVLLQETENHLKEMLKAASITPSHSSLDELKNWPDTDIQDLLHYISKQDLIKAIQNTSLEIQNIFMRNVPPTLWQDLIQQAQLTPCSKGQSLQAQEKIMRLAQLLKKGA